MQIYVHYFYWYGFPITSPWGPGHLNRIHGTAANMNRILLLLFKHELQEQTEVCYSFKHLQLNYFHVFSITLQCIPWKNENIVVDKSGDTTCKCYYRKRR